MEELRLSEETQKELEEFKKAYKEWELAGDRLFNCKDGSTLHIRMDEYPTETVIGIALNHAIHALQKDIREIEEILKERERCETTKETDIEAEADNACTRINT